MDSRKIVYKETAIVAVGEVIGTALLVAVYAIIGKFTGKVLWSALTGCGVMIANYFIMAVTVSNATDRARAGDPAGAKKAVQLSGILRLLLMAGVLGLGILLGAEVVALVVPLLFVRPTLFISEFFRKKGDA